MCCYYYFFTVAKNNNNLIIDESSFVRSKYNVGCTLPQRWSFVGIYRDMNEFFIEMVEERTESTLLEIIKPRIHPGTNIVSDCCKMDWNLNQHGFTHSTMNHKYNFVVTQRC